MNATGEAMAGMPRTQSFQDFHFLERPHVNAEMPLFPPTPRTPTAFMERRANAAPESVYGYYPFVHFRIGWPPNPAHPNLYPCWRC